MNKALLIQALVIAALLVALVMLFRGCLGVTAEIVLDNAYLVW